MNELDRTVILIIDEIYVAKRVEYSSGEVQGLTADRNVASTLLCFMIKSLVSKYKDIVAMPTIQYSARSAWLSVRLSKWACPTTYCDRLTERQTANRPHYSIMRNCVRYSKATQSFHVHTNSFAVVKSLFIRLKYLIKYLV